MVGQALVNRSVNVHWGLLELDIPLGAPMKVIDAAIWLKAPATMLKFQAMYPDRYRFRVKLIDEALRYERHDPFNVGDHTDSR